MQLTIGPSTHEKLCHAQALLGHGTPSGDHAQVKRAVWEWDGGPCTFGIEFMRHKRIAAAEARAAAQAQGSASHLGGAPSLT